MAKKFESQMHVYNTCRYILKCNGYSDFTLLGLGPGFRDLCFEVYDLEKELGETWEKLHLHRPTKVLLDKFNKIEDFSQKKVLEMLIDLADDFTLYREVANNPDNKEAYEALYRHYGKFDFQRIKTTFCSPDLLEETSGIYFLYTNDMQLVYIGRSVNLGSRLPSSIRERSKQLNQYIAYFRIAPVHQKPLLDIYEAYYIALHKPTCNVTGVYDGDLELELQELDFTDYIEINNLFVEG